jgi:hypothetical protein
VDRYTHWIYERGGNPVKAVAEEVREAKKFGKPIFRYLHTGRGWASVLRKKKGREPLWPTDKGIRASVYQAIIEGASGISWWCYHYAKTTGTWPAISQVAKEVQMLEPIIVSKPIKRESIRTNSEFINTSVRNYKGKWYLFAVNTENRKIESTFNLDIDNLTSSFKAAEFFEGYDLPIRNKSFKDTFDGWGVHVYEIYNTDVMNEPS